jgi:hypothetical protein
MVLPALVLRALRARTAQTVEIEYRVTGFYKVQKAIAEVNSVGLYRGAFRDSLSGALRKGRNYAERITHVLTGNLARSHLWEYDSHRLAGRIYIDPRVVYARGSTLQWPRFYGPYEEARGGAHAFYARTAEEMNTYLRTEGMRRIVRYIDTRMP